MIPDDFQRRLQDDAQHALYTRAPEWLRKQFVTVEWERFKLTNRVVVTTADSADYIEETFCQVYNRGKIMPAPTLLLGWTSVSPTSISVKENRFVKLQTVSRSGNLMDFARCSEHDVQFWLLGLMSDPKAVLSVTSIYVGTQTDPIHYKLNEGAVKLWDGKDHVCAP